MESLGVLAGGVAHDLNNMLGPLVGYPELILRKLPDDSPLRKQVQRMGNAAADAAEIIQDLLTLARRGRYEMGLIDLNEVIHNFLDSPTFTKLIEEKSQVEVEIELDESIRNMNGSSHQLSKVIMNLIVNAFDAISDQGRLIIRTREEDIEKLHCGHDKVKPGHYIVLSIEDNGMGIPAEDLSKIFEPYYSKKKMGRSGSGLGLSVVYGIVKDHKGYYDVVSTVGEGTQFILYFPIDLSGKETTRIAEIALEGAESILVVDDVEEQREMAAELLQSLGYQVTTVAGGQQAVEYLAENKVDLVVLDMIMEENWDGLTTFQEVQRLNPQQKAIIVSGFSPTDRVRSMQTLGAGAFLRKPYTLEAIGRAVRLELDRTGKTVSA
jgi:CheY-like chemotaxis protein